MSDDRSRAQHRAHEDNRHEHTAAVRLAALRAQEEHARFQARLRTVRPLVQEPAHAFLTPIVDRFDQHHVVDHMLAPGSTDDTGFSDGRV